MGKLREANSPMSAIVAPFVGELPRSTWLARRKRLTRRERELLWDILYRKDVLPRAAVESAIDSGDESLFICMKSCFEVGEERECDEGAIARHRAGTQLRLAGGRRGDDAAGRRGLRE